MTNPTHHRQRAERIVGRIVDVTSTPFHDASLVDRITAALDEACAEAVKQVVDGWNETAFIKKAVAEARGQEGRLKEFHKKQIASISRREALLEAAKVAESLDTEAMTSHEVAQAILDLVNKNA